MKNKKEQIKGNLECKLPKVTGAKINFDDNYCYIQLNREDGSVEEVNLSQNYSVNMDVKRYRKSTSWE